MLITRCIIQQCLNSDKFQITFQNFCDSATFLKITISHCKMNAHCPTMHLRYHLMKSFLLIQHYHIGPTQTYIMFWNNLCTVWSDLASLQIAKLSHAWDTSPRRNPVPNRITTASSRTDIGLIMEFPTANCR